jgi:hypothetical protein
MLCILLAVLPESHGVGFGRVVWDGHYVRAGVPLVLSFGSPAVAVTSPAAIAGPTNSVNGVADDEDCSPNSKLSPTIVIGGIDPGLPNTVLENGCSSNDLIAQIAAAADNHGEFVSAVAHLTNEWQTAGVITGRQKGALENAAARTTF